MDKPRNFYKDTFHHLYNRGAFQQKIFFEKNDFEYFLRKLIEYKERYSIKIFSYCLMPNHFHLFVKQTLDDQTISKFISGLANSYTKGINIKYKRTGVLFAGKTKSKQIEDDSYFKWVVKYILGNPVKAKKFDEYNFSSATEIVNNIKTGITDVNDLLSYFDSIDSFKDFMQDEKQKSDYEIFT